MHKLRTILLVSFILLLSFSNPTISFAAPPSIDRLSGTNRYETNAAIVQNGWSEAQNVIIANGENFPDALCAAPLAKLKNAPILLTTRDSLSASTLTELFRLKSKNAYIIGGTGVISEEVETQLNAIGINTVRFSGATRYETSVKIAEQIGTEKGIVIAAGENFPDALSIAPIAAQKGMPILLASRTSLPEEVKTFLQGKTIPVSYVIGGVGALSTDIKASLKNPIRLSGMNRYETNIKILNQFEDSLNLNSIYIASAQNFPDALSGSALAANSNSPILLLDNDISEVSSDYLSSINAKKITLLGGTGVLSGNTENTLLTTLKFLKITQVDPIEDVAFIGENYNFPPSALATFEDSSQKLVRIKWNSNSLDTSIPSTYNFEGTVSGYDKKIPMIVNVIEETGVMHGNLSNGGMVAYYKGDLYFCNINDNSKIYKIDSTGKLIKLNDDSSSSLNIVKDHIYYLTSGKPYKMNLDGSEKTKLLEDETLYTTTPSSTVNQLIVDGDWIYYSLSSPNTTGIYKIKTNGSNKLKLGDDDIYTMTVSNGYIYYSNKNDGNSIYKININGSEKTKISDDVASTLNVVENWIYYLKDEGTPTEKGQPTKIYKVKTDGTGRAKVFDGWAQGLNISNGWIYFSNALEGDKLYKIRIDGTDAKVLAEDRAAAPNIIGEWIFYNNLNYNKAGFMVRIDGSSNTRFDIPTVYEKEPNESLSTATELSISRGYGDAKKMHGHLGANDIDFFKDSPNFSTSPYYLNVIFIAPGIGSNATVTFIDAYGDDVYSVQSSYDGTASFSVDFTDNPQATFHIKVTSPNGNLIEDGDYDLITWYAPHS